MTATVVVVGSINADETLPVASWPVPGETALLTGPVLRGLGGKGANQAVAATLAGADVALVGAVGQDATGNDALRSLRGHGVDVDGVRTVPGSTGRALIVVDPRGENLILVDPGANAVIDAEMVREAAGHWAAETVVLVQGEVSRAVIDAVAAACRAVGARFVLNLAPFVEVGGDTLATADPLVVNEIEAAQLGIDPTAEAGALPACSLVVTLGADGAVVRTAAGTQRLPARSVEVVDTTGAGDAFVGTLAARLAAGADLATSAAVATQAAAYAVAHRGAAASYGTREQIERFAGVH
ncbi:ribokinase [Microbacterium sp. 1P10AE]|uniref:ribokinase n=1 Tax=Microbacterium sp. 1P10AE TaxID=3132286 RepID=UPI00399FA8AE